MDDLNPASLKRAFVEILRCMGVSSDPSPEEWTTLRLNLVFPKSFDQTLFMNCAAKVTRSHGWDSGGVPPSVGPESTLQDLYQWLLQNTAG